MLNILLGTGISANYVVAILEFVLAIYSVALAFCTSKKDLKIIHGISTAVWVVLALTNIFI